MRNGVGLSQRADRVRLLRLLVPEGGTRHKHTARWGVVHKGCSIVAYPPAGVILNELLVPSGGSGHSGQVSSGQQHGGAVSPIKILVGLTAAHRLV